MHGIILNGGSLEKYYNGDFAGWSWKYHSTSENSMNYAIWRLFLSTAMLANSSPLAAALLAQVGKSFGCSVFWVAECTAGIPCVKLEMWLDTAFKPPALSSSNSYLISPKNICSPRQFEIILHFSLGLCADEQQNLHTPSCETGKEPCVEFRERCLEESVCLGFLSAGLRSQPLFRSISKVWALQEQLDDGSLALLCTNSETQALFTGW